MVPSAEHLMKKRHHTQRRLRFMAMTMVVVAGVFPIMMVAYQLIDDPSLRTFSLDELRTPLAWAVGFAVPAILLWVLDRWLSRLLVPMPRSLCPACGYSLEHLTRPQCPECGLSVPKVFVLPRAPATQPPTTAPDTNPLPT